MISLGIVWNSSYYLKEQIIEDIKNQANVLDVFDLRLGKHFEQFLYEIYKSENMEKFKIDKKFDHINKSTIMKTISVVVFDFDDSIKTYHEQKKCMVYKNLDDIKKSIREKYSTQINNYCFDIVFHSSDNLEEVKRNFCIIKKYIEYIRESDLEQFNEISKIINNDEGIINGKH